MIEPAAPPLSIHTIVVISLTITLGIAYYTFTIYNTSIAAAISTVSNGIVTNNSAYSYSDNNKTTYKEYTMPLLTKLLADVLNSRLEKSAAILEITSGLPEITSRPDIQLLNQSLEAYHGIPESVNDGKRNVARNILSNYDDFSSVFFLTPNGDMYMLEPYSGQQNLTMNNWAFRNYYKGAIANNDTYLDDVISFVATNENQVIISLPIYSEMKNGNNDSDIIDNTDNNLRGVWAGALNLDIYDQLLQSFDLPFADIGERILILDSKGQKIADSFDENSLSQPYNDKKDLVSFNNLTGFQNALNGEEGSFVEIVNGTQIFISYSPVKAFHNTVIVLWMIPINNNSIYMQGNQSQMNE
jgi:hypothetical protein